MPVTVPIDLDVTGGGLAETIEKDLKTAEAAAGHAGADAGDAFGDGFSREVSRSAKEVDALLAEATRTRNADISVDIDGAGQLPVLEAALAAVEGTHVARVEVDVDRDVFRNLAGSATQGSGAISEAFSGAFQLVAKNAIILSVVVAAAFATLPVAGAAAATGIVLGFGSALAGIGILAAAQSKEVQSAFKEMAKGIVGDVKEMAIPFESTLLSIAEFTRRTFDNFAPALNDSFAQMAPVLTIFANNLLRAFEKLEPAIAPLTDAFTSLLDAIGPRLDGFFTNLSDSLVNLSDVISSDPDLFAALFVGILNILPTVINMIAGLAEAFKVIVDAVRAELVPAWDQFTAAIAPLTSALAGSTSGMDIFKAVVAQVVTSLVVFISIITFTVNQVRALVGGLRAAGAGIAATWRNTLTVTSNVWNRIRASVSNAISRVVSVVAGGLARIRTGFSSGFNAARAVVTGAMGSIRAAVTGAISRVVSIVAGGLGRVRAAFSSGFAAARSVVTGAMGSIRSAVSSGIGRVISVVAGLPGRIRGALGNLGSMLFSSGYSMISGLADGIRAGISNAISAAQDAVSSVRNFFPFSPAKEGPFSGSGYTTYSGEALMKDFAKSMEDTANAVTPRVAAALNPLASAVPSVAGRPAGSSTSRTTTINNGIDIAALAALMSQITLNVTLGRDRRTTAEWWLDGQQLAASLS